MDPEELQQAFEVIRRASREDIHRTIEDLRRRAVEQPGVIQISASGASKSSGSVTMTVVSSSLTAAWNVSVPSVLVDEPRPPVMTLERAVKSVIIWLVVTGAALASQGEKGGAEAFAWLAAILDAVDGLAGTFKDDDDG